MDKKDVLVLGTGYLGQTFEDYGYRVVGRNGFNYGAPAFNGAFDYTLDQFKPKAIINCIGNANTRECETVEGYKEANKLNNHLVGYLKYVCDHQGIKLVHISSGCLYDNSAIPQAEDDFTVAHCSYVVTKWAGEKCLDPYEDLIIRPRLYYGKKDLPKNLLCKLEHFDRYCTSLDSITSVETIVEATTALLENDQVGVFNVANSGYISMFQIARLMYPHLTHLLQPMTSEELREQENLYLVNCTMDISKLEKFYKPRTALEEVTQCWAAIKNERDKV